MSPSLVYFSLFILMVGVASFLFFYIILSDWNTTENFGIVGVIVLWCVIEYIIYDKGNKDK